MTRQFEGERPPYLDLCDFLVGMEDLVMEPVPTVEAGKKKKEKKMKEITKCFSAKISEIIINNCNSYGQPEVEKVTKQRTRNSIGTLTPPISISIPQSMSSHDATVLFHFTVLYVYVLWSIL